MRYIIEDENNNIIKEFSSARERKTWTDCNCYLEFTEAGKMAYYFMGTQIYYYEED